MLVTTINSSIALILGTSALKYRKDPYCVILILFMYISLHYSYAIISIIGTPKYIMLCRALRETPQVGAKIVALVFLLFISGLLIGNKSKPILAEIKLRLHKSLFLFSIIWIAAVAITWSYEINQANHPTGLVIQSILSSLMMLVLAFIIATAIASNANKEATMHLKKMFWILLLLVIIMDTISISQFATLNVFAGGYNKNGEYAIRACALLYNPNVFGMWCGFIALITSYGFHANKYSKTATTMMLFLVSLGMLLSGSRSGLLVCLFMLGTVTFLHFRFGHRDSFKFTMFPLFVFVSSLTGIGLLLKTINSIANRSIALFKWLSSSVDRFAFMPGELYDFGIYNLTRGIIAACYWLHKHTGHKLFENIINYLTDISNNQSVVSILENLDGRLNSDVLLPDNGYLAMLQDAGWLGLIAWLLICLAILATGLKSFRIDSGINGIYALSAVCTCLFAALFIRAFQLFPIWIMVAIAMGISLAWFQTVFRQQRSL